MTSNDIKTVIQLIFNSEVIVAQNEKHYRNKILN
jgi:hypothetical protein